MSSPKTLRFLHFSDIHFGQERGGTIWYHEEARAEVLHDCRSALIDGLVEAPPDAVLVTGDLAYSGKEAEFKKAGTWLDDVTLAAGCDRRAVRMIAGNHDVDVSKLGEEGLSYHSHLRSLDVANCLASMDRLAQNGSFFAKLDDYRAFAAAYDCDFDSPAKPVHEKVYPLYGGKPIKVSGFCSVLLSDLQDSPGNLLLGPSQYLKRDVKVETLAMVHHPLNWFKDQQAASPFFFQRARLLLTGHEHLPDLSVTQRRSFQQALIAAGALNPPNVTVQNTYTYNWIELSWLTETSLLVRVFPRSWNPTAVQFDADYQRTGGKTYVDLVLECGLDKAASGSGSRHLETKPAPEEVSTTQEEGLPTSRASDASAILPSESREVSSMSDVSAQDTANKQRKDFDTLRFLFWRHLGREARRQVLEEVGLVREASGPLTHAYEKMAFDRAFNQSLQKTLWDAAMQKVPSAERRPNPFVNQEHV